MLSMQETWTSHGSDAVMTSLLRNVCAGLRLPGVHGAREIDYVKLKMNTWA